MNKQTQQARHGWLSGVYTDNARSLSREAALQWPAEMSPMLDPGRAPLTGEEFGEVGVRWAREGVDIIGGCCGFTPADIACFVRALERNERSAESDGHAAVADQREGHSCRTWPSVE